jgi:hypothetical protein
MFVLFRTRRRRIYVTLAETAREAGKVRQRHVASIGSIAIGADEATAVHDRVRLWRELHPRLTALKLDPEDSGKIMAAVHRVIPMPSAEQAGSVELRQAEQILEGLNGGQHNTVKLIEAHQMVIARSRAAVAQLQAEIVRETELIDQARAKVARLANYPRPDNSQRS